MARNPDQMNSVHPGDNYFAMTDGRLNYPTAPPPKLFTPNRDFVAVWFHPRDPSAKLALPDGVQDPGQAPLATVIAVGPKCTCIKEGDVVVCHPTVQAVAINHKGQCYSLLFEENIVGVLNESEAEEARAKYEVVR